MNLQLRIVAAVAVLVLIAVAIFLFTSDRPAAPEQTAAVPADPTAGSRANRTSKEHDRERAEPAKVPAETAENISQPPAQPDETVDARESDEPRTVRVTLRFKEPGGEPVPGFRFEYWPETTVEFARALAEGFSASSRDGVADDQGVLVIEEPALSARTRLTSIRVKSGDPQWALSGAGDHPAELPDGQIGFWFGNEAFEHDISVTVTRSRPVSFAIRYEDGQPFAGGLGVSVNLGNRQYQRFTGTASALEEYELNVPATFETLVITVAGHRRGFRVNHSARFTPETLLGRNEIVIPEDRGQTGILLRFAHWPEGELVVSVFDEHAVPIHITFWRAPDNWQFLELRPGTTFHVRVTSEAGVWGSGPLQAVSGSVIERSPSPEKGVTFTARLLNEADEPLARAVLSPWPDACPPWEDIAFYYNGAAGVAEPGVPFSGPDGRVTLADMPPGTYRLLAGVEGYHLQVRTVTGRAGETVDLGDIVCMPATGRITVKLTGRREGAEYSVYLLSPGNDIHTVASRRNVEDGEIVFDRLSPRVYEVVVTAIRVSTLGDKHEVNVAAGDQQELAIDVSSLPTTVEEWVARLKGKQDE